MMRRFSAVFVALLLTGCAQAKQVPTAVPEPAAAPSLPPIVTLSLTPAEVQALMERLAQDPAVQLLGKVNDQAVRQLRLPSAPQDGKK